MIFDRFGRIVAMTADDINCVEEPLCAIQGCAEATPTFRLTLTYARLGDDAAIAIAFERHAATPHPTATGHRQARYHGVFQRVNLERRH